ncbi:MAG: hypothetical protein R3A79_21875 [Nannocystaceae bacterium]
MTHHGLNIMISAALALGLSGLGCDSKVDEGSATAADSDSDSTGGSDSSSTSGDGSGSSGSSTSGGTATSTSGGTGGVTSDSTGGSTDSTSTTDATTGMSSVTSATTNSSSVTTDATDGTDSSSTGEPPEACGDLPPIEGLVTSMAYLKSQVPPDMTSSGSSTSTTSGGEIDPSTMYISLSSQAMECKDPNAGLECGPNWEVSISIPPELQTPGVYAVGLGDIHGFAAETGPDEGGDVCGFGGGTWEATLEIVAIDDTMVEARLCNVDEWFWSWTSPDLNGTFYAERCPG